MGLASRLLSGVPYFPSPFDGIILAKQSREISIISEKSILFSGNLLLFSGNSHFKRGDVLLSTVHTYLNLKKNERGLTLGKIEQALSIKHPALSMSDTKLSRIFKDPQTKISIEELLAIVDCMGLDKLEILAILGEQEYRASEGVGYKGATELIADFERREASQRDFYENQLAKEAALRKNIHDAFKEVSSAFDHSVKIIQQNHAAALQERDSVYTRTVTHLKTQLLTDAEEYHHAITSKDEALATMATHAGAAMKSVKWWRLTAVFVIAVLVVVFLYVVWEIRNLDKGATAILIQMVRDGLI